MQTLIRTTIRVRKDLFDQSRMLAFKRGISLQDVINETLALGFAHVSDLNLHQQAINRIDKFRQSLNDERINIDKILKQSKKDLK